MNLLARAKISSAKRLFYLHPVTALQQCNFYSTKPQQPTKPRTQKSSQPSLSFSQRIKKQTDALVWPKPREIPYHEKVANFVNLIGYVKIPVQFESASDGNHFATTVISLGNVGDRSSLSIPVVFEGDLAHVVACHVKESDCVFVSGRMSADAMRLVVSENLGKFHVVAENVNFVEGLERNVVDKNLGVSLFSDVEIEKPGKGGVEKVDDGVYFNKMLKDVFKHEKAKEESSYSVNAESNAQQVATLEPRKNEFKQNEKGGESFVSKKKDADQILDLWRDLVKNPSQWWDYRDHKSKGLVKEKYPDFKQKGSGEGLWISSAPKWVFPGIGKLEFDVKEEYKPRQVYGGEGRSGDSTKKSGKSDESWKSLVENPDKWWDNRSGKRNPKAPDFKHKETGEVLWLSTLPVWASSKLPPMKNAV